jgi:type I restriction enzyme M protein
MKQVGNAAGVFAEFMSKATFIIATPRLLDQATKQIDKIFRKENY